MYALIYRYTVKKGYSELLITQTSLLESIKKMYIELEMDIISQFKM